MNEIQEYIFRYQDTWLIKISHEGIRFNREFYPDTSPQDFAHIFMETLEEHYDVVFIEKRK